MASQMDGENKQNVFQDDAGTADTIPALPPPPPAPSTDLDLISQSQRPQPPYVFSVDAASAPLFELSPAAALALLCAGIGTLVSVTDDTPPTSPPPMPNTSSIQEAAIVRLHSERDPIRIQQHQQPQRPMSRSRTSEQGYFKILSDTHQFQPVDGVRLRHPYTPPQTATPRSHIIIGENWQPADLQHHAITRKFFSKASPSLSIDKYLMRIHRFCPMSTAVYLATSFYLFRLAVQERVIAVTSRNCHRLLLAGLRVAMKALEDETYSHAKFAKVGGVSEAELARLEISFCFLVRFRLVVNGETMRNHLEMLQQNIAVGNSRSSRDVAGTVPNLGVDVLC